MIKLYREEASAEADTIEAEFREMVLGYERVVIEPVQACAMFGEHGLPIITNNEKIVSGDGIRLYLKELEMLVRDWQLFQGDYCYVEEDGTENCS
jgi:hypothetical protein